MTHRTLLITVAALLAVAGCADMKVTPNPMVRDTIVNNPPAPNPDVELVAAVKSELARQPQLKAGHLDISAKGGEVTVKGDVEDGMQLYQIGLAVQKVKGVRAVINGMNPKR
ncbi:MAG: BON domain-containing protein [Betaproteobacteria bacterium]|nr:BON domain-containing protein [Betaproteobacteria bacterium]